LRRGAQGRHVTTHTNQKEEDTTKHLEEENTHEVNEEMKREMMIKKRKKEKDQEDKLNRQYHSVSMKNLDIIV